MGDIRIQDMEDKLRMRVRRFMSDKSSYGLPRQRILQTVRESAQRAFLCGGAVRDIMLSTSRNNLVPRDLDIVLAYTNLEDVAAAFSEGVKRRNRYGGVSIEIKNWSLDIWLLNKTWAFENNYVEVAGFSDFPKTTFLDIEAVAVELFAKKGRKREIYSKGFFEAILKRTIEINLEDNPNPTTSIVRALSVAKKLKFAIGRNLANYILHYSSRIDLQELANLYETRYPPSRFRVEDIHSCVQAIREQLRVSGKQRIKLPKSENENRFQTMFWSNLFRHDKQGAFSGV